MSKEPFIDAGKLNQLKNNLDCITEMSKILLDIHERKYKIVKNNLDLFESDVNKFSTENFSSSHDIKDLFFDEIFPLFLKNLNLYVTFKEDLKDTKKDFISILNIPYLVKLTTKNMILHLIVLTNYKSLISEATIKIKENYAKELCLLFHNLDFNCLLIEIDKEMSTNIMINSTKKNSDILEFTNLKQVYEDVFKHMNSSFENEKFAEIFKTISDLTQDLKQMIGVRKNAEKEIRTSIKLNENELDLSNLSCFLNYEKNSEIINKDILNMISESDFHGNFAAEGKTKKRKYSDSDSASLSDSDSDSDYETINKSSDSETMTFNETGKDYNFEIKDPDYINKIDLSNLFESLKTKLINIHHLYYNSDNKNNNNNIDSTWKEIVKIYEQFDSILEKLIQDTNKLKTEYFSPNDANSELVNYFKEINDDNIYKYLSLDNNLDVAQTAILSALPFQNLINKEINDCTLIIQKYLSEYEQIERKMISNKVLISSLVRHQLHAIKGSTVTFPLINFLPVDLIDLFSNLVLNFNLSSMFEMFSKLETNGYFLSICGFVCTPIEKLILICENQTTKLFDNTMMIQKMEKSHHDTIGNLFLFLEMFTFQIRKQSRQEDFKSCFYYTINNKSDRLKRKEIVNTCREYAEYPFSFLKCVSSTFHSAVINQSQFKQALLLIQTYFGMVEPLFILSCLLKKNEKYILEILYYLVNQNSYEYQDSQRVIKFEVPLLLEAFLVRFVVFFIFLHTNLKILSTENESISLECKHSELIKIFHLIQTKKRIVEKFNQFGITINSNNTVLYLDFDIKPHAHKSNTTYTIKQEFFKMCTEYDKKLPDILSFTVPNNESINNKQNRLEKLSKNYLEKEHDLYLKNIDCLRILQQLDNSIFGAISLQLITMNEFNYKLNNLHFAEKMIRINFVN